MTRMRAFTLLEVLVAIALVMALLSTIFVFLRNLGETRARTLEHVHQHRTSSLLMQRIEADLMTCIAGDRVVGAGIAGTSDSLQILARSVAVHYVSDASTQGQAFGDLQSSMYRFDRNRMQFTLAQSAASSVRSRRAQPIALDGVIHHARFRYYDGSQWLDSFDSIESARLPVAVELALWLHPIEPVDPFAEADALLPSTEVDMPYANEFDDESVEDEFFEDPFDDSDLPEPDRVRVFLIPDAASTDSVALEGDGL